MATKTDDKNVTNVKYNVDEGFRLWRERTAQGLYFFPHAVVVDGRLHVSFNTGGGRIFVGRPDPALTPEAAAAEKAAIIAATKESIIAKKEV